MFKSIFGLLLPVAIAFAQTTGTATLVGLLLSASATARTAWLGGEIRHPETTGPLWAPPDVSKSVLLDSASTPRHRDRD